MVAKKGGAWLGFTLIGILVGLFVISIFVDLGLEGTDDRASSTIGVLNPEYRPWFHNFFEPSEREEKALFAFQILLGAGIGGYCLWWFRNKSNAR